MLTVGKACCLKCPWTGEHEDFSNHFCQNSGYIQMNPFNIDPNFFIPSDAQGMIGKTLIINPDGSYSYIESNKDVFPACCPEQVTERQMLEETELKKRILREAKVEELREELFNRGFREVILK